MYEKPKMRLFTELGVPHNLHQNFQKKDSLERCFFTTVTQI